MSLHRAPVATSFAVPLPTARLRGLTAKAGSLLGAALLLLVAAGAVALVAVPKATGSVPLTVLTGSMDPTYPPGSVVVVRPTPVQQLRIGDPITYQVRPGEPDVVTHRIIGVTTGADGSLSFVTQGDNNDAPDPEPVLAEQVRGRVWYSVPLVGHAITALAASPYRDLAVRLSAWGLLGYGGWLVLAGTYGHARARRARTHRP